MRAERAAESRRPAERVRFAAACLCRQPYRDLEDADVRFWERADVLLPIAHALDSCREVTWHAAALDVLAHARRTAAAVEAGERHVLRETLHRMKAEHVDVLLLKGAALSYTVYPAPWLRARSDLDVLVRPGTMDRVTDVLTDMGFVRAREVSHPLITRQRHFVRSGAFCVAFDVHDALINPPLFCNLPAFERLWSGAQGVAVLNGKALSTADALLHALIHRVAHHNSADDLLWFYDMHLLTARMSDREWAVFEATATTSRVCQIACEGLQQVVRIMGSVVPPDLIESLGRVAGEPSAELLGGALTEWRLQWINFKRLDGLRSRVSFVRAHLLPPAAELAECAEPWPLPLRYANRALRGTRRWLRPISRGR